MLKFGNTFVNVGGTYLTGFTKHENIPLDEYGWSEVFNMSSNDQVDTLLPGHWGSSITNEYVYNHDHNVYQPKCTFYDETPNNQRSSAEPLNFNFHVPNVNELTYMLMSLQEFKHVKCYPNGNGSTSITSTSAVINQYFLPIMKKMSFDYSINDIPTSSVRDDSIVCTLGKYTQNNTYIWQNDDMYRYDLIKTVYSSYFDSNYRFNDGLGQILVYPPSGEDVHYLALNHSILIKNNGDSCDMSAYAHCPCLTGQTSIKWGYEYRLQFMGSATYNNKITDTGHINCNFVSAGQTNVGDFGWMYHSYVIPKLSVSACYDELDTNKLNELLQYTVSV